jgi:glycosyltransferase involved in cell wall biosynthesis
MPVHNALRYLDEAVESILTQTYSHFEFVILDDASTDGSKERLREWASRDRRIRLLEVGRNLGPALSSQKVATEASAPVVARMDADDISYPERLARQLDVIERNPDVGVVGGLFDIIDASGRKVRSPEPWRLFRQSVFPPFGNGPMMYRRSVFDRVGGYRRECEFWEDQDLLIRMAAVSKVMVIPDAIYQVRQSSTSTRFVSEQARLERAVDLMYRSRGRLELGRDYEDLLSERSENDGKLDPRVFISLGSVSLWAGGNPRLFRRLLKRGKLTADFRTVSAVVWTAWASANPTTLKLFMRLLLVLRNRFASRSVDRDRPVTWSPRTAIAPETAERQLAT